MKKRLLSVVLALSILFTMLPVSVVGEEVHNGTDSSDENLTFEEFVETEKVVPSGTSVEDLELPESEQTQEEQGRDPKWEETTLDIPEMMEASLIMDDIVIPMDVSNVAQIKDVGYTNLQDAFSNVTEGDTIELLGNITLESTVTIVSGNNKSFALDLNGFTLDGVRNSAIQHSGTGTLTIKDSAGDGKITSKAYIDSNGTIDLRGGSLVVESGTIENNLNSVDANAILKDHRYNGVIIVAGGTISSLHGTAIYYGYTSDFEMPSGIIIPSGTPVIKGGLRAMYPAPDLSEYEGVVIASENYDGSGPVIVYNTDDIYIYGYKYLEFGADAVIDYIPVTDIVMTNVHSVQVDTNLTLAGTVSPDTATNRAIIWSMENANGTGATINDNIFRATSSGTATVRATVINGLTDDSDYTETFDLTVTAPPIINYTITPTAQIGGTISPNEIVTVNKGESQTFNIVPKKNYSISDVKVDNISQGPISSYTFNNVTANHTISASFRYNGGSSGSRNRRPSKDDKNDVIITDPSTSQPDSPIQEDLDTPDKVDSPIFTDISGHWALEDIEFVVSRGLFSGTSVTSFSPNSPMTRGMFVTVLGRLANVDVTAYHESSFKDVKNHAYYMGYIEWASENKIVKGIGNDNFGPDEAISREQMAVIINNFANTMGLKLTPVHGEDNFADSWKISIYAKDAVKHMQMAGILSGRDGKLFDPQATSTRAEVSAVIHRFVKLVSAGTTIR